MSSLARPQDLPPSSGYSKIFYDKVPHKTFFNGPRIFLFTLVSYGIGCYGYSLAARRVRRTRLETQSATNAIQPFLLAERDRQLLRQMRRNRDAENKLMKNVKGWETGTLFGTPVYNTPGENEWIGYEMGSYYAHAHPDEAMAMENFEMYV